MKTSLISIREGLTSTIIIIMVWCLHSNWETAKFQRLAKIKYCFPSQVPAFLDLLEFLNPMSRSGLSFLHWILCWKVDGSRVGRFHGQLRGQDQKGSHHFISVHYHVLRHRIYQSVARGRERLAAWTFPGYQEAEENHLTVSPRKSLSH